MRSWLHSLVCAFLGCEWQQAKFIRTMQPAEVCRYCGSRKPPFKGRVIQW